MQNQNVRLTEFIQATKLVKMMAMQKKMSGCCNFQITRA